MNDSVWRDLAIHHTSHTMTNTVDVLSAQASHCGIMNSQKAFIYHSGAGRFEYIDHRIYSVLHLKKIKSTVTNTQGFTCYERQSTNKNQSATEKNDQHAPHIDYLDCNVKSSKLS